MKKILTFLLLAIGLTTSVLAQEFTITDYRISGVSNAEANELQKEWLGGSISLAFFDRTVKLENFHDSKGVEYTNMKFPILNKIDNDTYSFIDKGSKTVLKLNKIAGYIRSATVSKEDYEEKIKASIKLTRK